MFKKFFEFFNSCGLSEPSAPLGFPEEPFPDPAAENLESFDCPSCGGPLEIDFIGRHQVDKVANCPYCKRTIDLPEAASGDSRVRTRERVIERPNEKIVERVSEWTQRSSTTLDWSDDATSKLGDVGPGLLRDKWKDFPFGQFGNSSCEKWEINGEKFSTREEMLQYAREKLPNGMADRLLDLVDRARG